MTARFWDNKSMKKVLKMCEDGGFTINKTKESVKVLDGDVEILTGLLKPPSNWMVRYDPKYFN